MRLNFKTEWFHTTTVIMTTNNLREEHFYQLQGQIAVLANIELVLK
jgi:hypothetical protein